MNFKKCITILISTVVFLAGCGAGCEKVELTREEREAEAVRTWFENDMTDEDEFTDLASYRYYARTIGLDKDALLQPDMWEIYYSESVNINKDIDGTAIYLIRLNPDKLLEVWAANNETTAEDICKQLGTTRDDLYYNFGYTANSINYAKSHKDGKVSYPAEENKIFGADNGENRQAVFSTHLLKVNVDNKKKVRYCSSDETLNLKQRDFLKAVTNSKLYNYSDYTPEEISPVKYVNGVGIKRLMLLNIPNGWAKAADEKPSVMFNMSPFSYGCTGEDRLELFVQTVPEETEAETEETAEDSETPDTVITSDVPVEHPDESEGE